LVDPAQAADHSGVEQFSQERFNDIVATEDWINQAHVDTLASCSS
jgi:hypothetical protein